MSLHTLVEKILIDEETRTAYGVQIQKHDIKKTIYADREVILSAGALQSPQILMLSGVGPAEHLAENDIIPIVDAPGVGQNLQDHVAMAGIAYYIDPPTEFDENGRPWSFVLPKSFTTTTLKDFVFNKNGIMYGLPECEVRFTILNFISIKGI